MVTGEVAVAPAASVRVWLAGPLAGVVTAGDNPVHVADRELGRVPVTQASTAALVGATVPMAFTQIVPAATVFPNNAPVKSMANLLLNAETYPTLAAA